MTIKYRMLLGTCFALGMMAFSLHVAAQTPGHAEVSNGNGALSPGISTFLNRTLVASQFFVNNTDLAVEAQCTTGGCQATAPVYTPTITCPGPVSQTCTYYVQVAAQVSVTPNDFGEYRFLIDGTPPVHYQTDLSGYFNWVQQDPNSGLGVWEARSYAAVATVTNRTANQAHRVEVDIACYDVTGDGCIGAFGFGDLRVDVFRP
jgi:hypothetical protein